MDLNEAIFKRILDDEEFRGDVDGDVPDQTVATRLRALGSAAGARATLNGTGTTNLDTD